MATTIETLMAAANLEQLRDALLAMPAETTLGEDRALSDLPTFGGEAVDESGVFSWDEGRVLRCVADARDWVIEPRQ